MSAHAVGDDRDHQAAEDGVEHLALAAEQAGAADDGSADGVAAAWCEPPVVGDDRVVPEAKRMPPTAAMVEQMTKQEIRTRAR